MARTAKSHALHTSAICAAIIAQMEARESISLQDIVQSLGKRAFGVMILLFCLPNILPIPNITGLSAITGIPILWLGMQMAAGKEHPWFPAALGKKQFSSQKLGRFLARAIPYLRKLEVLLHPRMREITARPMQHVLGIVFIILATAMSLPIPFGNLLPGLAMALIAIGLIEHDGVMILLGLLVGAATIQLVITAADAIVSALHSLFS